MTGRTRAYFNTLEQPPVTQAVLDEEARQWAGYLLAHHVHYEGAAEPFAVAPFVLSIETYRRMARYLEPLSRLMEKCLALYASSPQVQEFFGFSPRLHRLIALQACQSPPAWYCRFDFVLGEDGVPRIMEVNGDCPAGLLQQMHYQALCRTSPLIARYFGRAAVATALESPQFVPDQIRLMGRERVGLAIVNSRHRTLRNEIDLYCNTLRRAGIACVIGMIEELQFRDRRLWLDAIPVDMVLTKFDVQREQHETPPVGACWEDIADFERAICEEAVLVCNGLAASVIAESKETLALLRGAEFGHHFDAAEHALIDACIPRTLRLDRLVPAEFEEFIADRPHWVLKRCMDTRGRSVVLGAEETDESWRERLYAARRDSARDFVLQQRVQMHECEVARSLPSYPPRIYTVFGGYVVHGQMAGLLVRSSRSAVTNVSQGGFVQPHLIV